MSCAPPSSPTCCCRLAGSWLMRRISRARSTLRSMAAAISSMVGSCPTSCTSMRCTRRKLWIFSAMCTGTRMVRDWSASARMTAWRIHQVA